MAVNIITLSPNSCFVTVVSQNPATKNQVWHIPYPDSFNQSNCRIISSFITDGVASWYGSTYLNAAQGGTIDLTLIIDGSYYVGAILSKLF